MKEITRRWLCRFLTLPGTQAHGGSGDCYAHVFVQPCFHGWSWCLCIHQVPPCSLYTQPMARQVWAKYSNGLKNVSTQAWFEPKISCLKVKCTNHKATQPHSQLEQIVSFKSIPNLIFERFQILGRQLEDELPLQNGGNFFLIYHIKGLHMVDFPTVFTREVIFVTSCLLSCTPNPFWKGLLYKERPN